MRVARRSCWAACAIVSYSAARCTTEPPGFLFSGDRLVQGELGASMLQAPVEHAPRSPVRIIRRVRGGVVVVGAVGGDVDEVRVPPAGHRDMQVFPCRRRISGHMRGAGGDALCPMHPNCVTEVLRTHSPMIAFFSLLMTQDVWPRFRRCRQLRDFAANTVPLRGLARVARDC